MPQGAVRPSLKAPVALAERELGSWVGLQKSALTMQGVQFCNSAVLCELGAWTLGLDYTRTKGYVPNRSEQMYDLEWSCRSSNVEVYERSMRSLDGRVKRVTNSRALVRRAEFGNKAILGRQWRC